MRVKIANPRSVGGYEFGEFLGILLDERETVQAVVRIDGYGLI